MKICLINNLYKPFAKGGAEKVTSNIAQGLLNVGHEVFIITTKPYLKQSPTRPADSPVNRLRIYYLSSLYFNLSRFPKFIRFFWHLWDMFDVVSYFKIKKILKKEKCDAAITNNLMGLGYLTSFLVKRLKVKHLHLVHDIQLIHPSGLLCYGEESRINGYFSRNYAAFSSQLFGSPEVVIFPSRWLLNLYLDKIFFIKSKRIVLANPVLPPLNLPLTKGENKRGGFPLVKVNKESGGNDIFKFLYLGQIEKHKGLNLLIQAFKKVREKFPQTELIVAGSGSELEPAKIQAEQDNGIKFLGWQDEPEINRLLRICHSLVMPTLCYENCPAVILEAFSAGLPVIAADLGGISELLGENAGLLFRPGNAVDLVDKMQWAIDHQSDLAEMAAAGRAKAALSNIEDYIKVLEGLMK